jgi:hypothetical protein
MENKKMETNILERMHKFLMPRKIDNKIIKYSENEKKIKKCVQDAREARERLVTSARVTSTTT